MSYFSYNGNKVFWEETGSGEPLILLHGNTASSMMFAPIIPLLSNKYSVITMDFLGCGQSERLEDWPLDLWFQWAEEVAALCRYKNLEHVNVVGTSGGAIAAINLALEHPEMVNKTVADSFEGIKADASVTDTIKKGREIAKQNDDFCAMLKAMHGDDWESVLDADTKAVAGHAQQVGAFFHRPLSDLRVSILLTGSAEDEMFPKGHYEQLFADICAQTQLAVSHVFEHGGHPAMMSNSKEFIDLCDKFLSVNRLPVCR